MKTEHINFDIPEETQEYHEVLQRALVSLVKDCQRVTRLQGLKVLDVGCGRGELLVNLTALGISVQGIDIEEECVLLSQQYAPVTQGSIYDLDTIFAAESFDIVIASHVLEHLECPKQGVEMLKRISRRNLILAVPNLSEFRNLRWRQTSPGFVNVGHQVGWDAPHFNTFLTYACGLTVEKWQPDRVYVHRFLQPILRLLGLLHFAQDKWLPQKLPFQSHSLIVLCTK